jgi:hypothetical protein
MCSNCHPYEGPYIDHSFAGQVSVERHIPGDGEHCSMDVEVTKYQCTCGELFGSKRELLDHFLEEA